MIASAGCPAFADTAPGAEGFGVAHALGSVDCHVGLVVQSGYGQLFGQHGAFGTVLTALLTLYVGFIAIALMTGRTRLTLTGLAPKGLAIGLVLTFATSWPAYHASVYGLLPVQRRRRDLESIGRLDEATTGLLLCSSKARPRPTSSCSSTLTDESLACTQSESTKRWSCSSCA